jgi:hypothetical protein
MVMSYVCPPRTRKLAKAAENGFYELVMDIVGRGIRSIDVGIAGACRGGHFAIVTYLAGTNAGRWGVAARYAAQYNNMGIIDLMESRNWKCVLAGACAGGHMGLIDVAMARGATNFGSGLIRACENGHLEVAKLMIAKGATCINDAMYGARDNGHDDLVDLMIEHGAED